MQKGNARLKVEQTLADPRKVGDANPAAACTAPRICSAPFAALPVTTGCGGDDDMRRGRIEYLDVSLNGFWCGCGDRDGALAVWVFA
jgi:hypothetical protein